MVLIYMFVYNIIREIKLFVVCRFTTIFFSGWMKFICWEIVPVVEFGDRTTNVYIIVKQLSIQIASFLLQVFYQNFLKSKPI